VTDRQGGRGRFAGGLQEQEVHRRFAGGLQEQEVHGRFTGGGGSQEVHIRLRPDWNITIHRRGGISQLTQWRASLFEAQKNVSVLES